MTPSHGDFRSGLLKPVTPRKLLSLFLKATLLMACAPVFAQTTPLGAIAAGNQDGSIPAWQGGLSSPPAGFNPEKGYANPFAAEKPLFVIDQSNVDQHTAFLPEGQVALIKRYAAYKIPVYPSHRTAVFSKELMDAVQQERGSISLNAKGNGVVGVKRSMVPFPEPKSGLEVVWNTLLRRPAETLQSSTASFVASENDVTTPVSTTQTVAWAHALGKDGGTLLFSLIGEITRPSAQAGEAVLVDDTLDFEQDARNAWIINAGQRKVLRAPELVHSAPAGNSDALRTIDDIYGFNGSPERYEWKLLGRKEMYIPYNNYDLSNKALTYAGLVQGPLLKPELTRFEKHRVWVVEGTLKPGMDHIYSRRVMYVDEDSWYVALMDQYDTKGNLWRVKALYLMQAYDGPGMYTAGEMQHDLNARKTIFSGFHNEEPATRFNIEAKSRDFTQSALRRRIR